MYEAPRRAIRRQNSHGLMRAAHGFPAWPGASEALPGQLQSSGVSQSAQTGHGGINLRLSTYGGLYAWEFERRGRELRVRVEGQLVFNNIALRLNAVLAGFGLAYLPEDRVQTHLADGRLIRVLDDWCPPFSGYHLYYPSRRQPTPAFALLVDALRYRD